MADQFTLRVLSWDAGSALVPIRESLVVWRGEGAGLKFPDDRSVSPRHARFLNENGSLFLEDLGSVNGIFLRVREPVLLTSRDRLRLGDHVFSFEIIPDLEATRMNITKVYSDPTTEVIGTKGQRARARLVVHLASGHRGKEYFIGDKSIVLGRGKGTHNFMSDLEISPKHAKITPLEGGAFRLTDLGSATGTWRQTRDRVAVTPGQELLIGRQRLSVLTA